MSNYKVGAVVKLKSDGPPMTISYICDTTKYRGKQLYECKWFYDNKVQFDKFNEDCLELIKNEPPEVEANSG